MAYRINPFTGRPDHTSDTMTGGWYIGTKDTDGSWKIALEGLNLAFYAHEGGSYVKKFSLGVAYPIAVAASAAFIALSSTNMTVDNLLYVGGNVGIGTNTPTEKLTVLANEGSPIASFGISPSSSVVIDTNGRVGIGVPSPLTAFSIGQGGTSRFDISAAGVITKVNNVTAGLSDSTLTIAATNATMQNSSTNAAGVLNIIGGAGTGSALRLRSTTSASASGDYIRMTVGTSGSTEAMRIISSGNVGIGTTTPTAKLDTGGGVKSFIDGTDDLLVKDDIESDGTIYGTDIITTSTFGIGNPDNNGSWRFTIVGGSTLEFQRRESGNWVMKGRVEP